MQETVLWIPPVCCVLDDICKRQFCGFPQCAASSRGGAQTHWHQSYKPKRIHVIPLFVCLHWLSVAVCITFQDTNVCIQLSSTQHICRSLWKKNIYYMNTFKCTIYDNIAITVLTICELTLSSVFTVCCFAGRKCKESMINHKKL